MGLFSFLRGAPAGAAPAPARVEPPVVAASSGLSSERQWNGFVAGGVSKAGVRVSEQTALSIPATLQALRVLTGVFAMTPVHYYRREAGGRVLMDDLPEGRLLSVSPNSHQTPFAFKELLLADMLLSGNSRSYISRNSRQDPVALTRLKPGTTVVAEYFDRAEGMILFYDCTLPDGTGGRFAARDIFDVTGFSRDGIQGLNPIAYARDALGGAIATADHTSKFWSKGGRPATVLESDKQIGPEAKAAIRRDWASLYAGQEGELVAVLDQALKASFLTHDMKASQMIETRQFQVADLARVWGVPPHLIFDLSKATFGNIEQQSLEFVIYHMGPHYKRVEEALTKAFARPGHYFEFLTDALVRGDLKSRMEAYWLQRQMGIANANELRQRENMPAIEGDAGDEFWRPGNMLPAGSPPDTNEDT